jgi:hypothetical protein
MDSKGAKPFLVIFSLSPSKERGIQGEGLHGLNAPK